MASDKIPPMTKTELIANRVGQFIHLDHATVERLREEAKGKGMEFLGAVLVGDRVIRLFFRDETDLIFREVRRDSEDPSLDIFHDYLKHNILMVDDGLCSYLEYDHRPN